MYCMWVMSDDAQSWVIISRQGSFHSHNTARGSIEHVHRLVTAKPCFRGYSSVLFIYCLLCVPTHQPPQMGSVMMTQPTMMYTQPVMRPANPFCPNPGAQVTGGSIHNVPVLPLVSLVTKPVTTIPTLC